MDSLRGLREANVDVEPTVDWDTFDRLLTLEMEYRDALAQAVTYRAAFLEAVALWGADHQRLVVAEDRLRQFLGAIPMHPDNDAA